MDMNQNLVVGFWVEGGGFDVGVDFGPLFGPVVADFVMAGGEASLEGFGPSDVGGHGGEGGVDVAGVEGGVGLAEEVDVGGALVWHGAFVGRGKGRLEPLGVILYFVSFVSR